ncbi:MAG: TonB C-terminal domain-containing protein [Deltaproteobacteria bacterium]|nr:TonB C-terminal domain-containing protein [Deltaproteobacteria bacterium]
MDENQWKIPLNFAIGIHLLFIVGAIYLPNLFHQKPRFADIYTVSLINITEPAPQSSPPPQAARQKIADKSSRPVPVKSRKTAPIADQLETSKTAPVKAISLKPLKKKKIKKVHKTVTKPDNSRSKEIARKRRQKLADAIQNEELAKQIAKEAQEALERERNLIKNTVAAPSTVRTPSNGGAGGGKSVGGSSNLIEARYLAAINGQLQQFWSLPEYMQKNPNLTAVVVITISKNGKIANMFFEDKSGDRMFDQFVSKTIKAASPFPPIPPAMKKQRYEIGLKFKPGGINF